MSEQPSVDVERRRKADKPTERAEAPIRRQTGWGWGRSKQTQWRWRVFHPDGGKAGWLRWHSRHNPNHWLLFAERRRRGQSGYICPSAGTADRKQPNHAKFTHQHTPIRRGYLWQDRLARSGW